MNAPAPAGTLAMPSIPLADIAPSPTNPRKHFDEAALTELASTIKDHGVIQPITVRPNPKGEPLYEIVVGERRWRASRLAGMTDIPAFWRDLTDQQVLEIQIIENLQRNDVHPLEEAEGYRQLMEDHGYTVEQIASKIGKDTQKKSYVYARLKLLDLCQEARNIMYERKLDASTALLVARIPTPGLQKQALQQIAAEGAEPMSYRAAKNHIQHNFTISLKQATFSLADASLVESAGSCQDCTKRSGNAPELFGDTEDGDVCSDTACFHAKKIAHHQQLLENAELNSTPIIRGASAPAMAIAAAHGYNQEYVALDAKVRDDEEGRTYREILGDEAPVSALIQSSETDVIEVASPTAMAEALDKAGWQPKEGSDNSQTKRVTPEELAALEEQRKAEERKRTIGTTWRKRLINRTLDAIHEHELDEGLFDELLTLLAQRYFLANYNEFGYFDVDTASRFGHEFPDHCDAEEEANKFHQAIKSWDSAKCFAYLFYELMELAREDMTHTEKDEATGFPIEILPATSLSLAHVFGIDYQAIIDEVTAEIDGEANAKPAKKAKKGPKSTPPVLAETASTPKSAAPAAGTGREDDGLEGRPSVRYALWGSAGWVTWSGKGRKPAWIEQWLANGKKLEDLEAKADPAPAAQANEKPASAATRDDSAGQGEDPAPTASGNESPAATGADSTNGDLFGQAGGEWPRPNEHGVYAADQAELITIDTKKAKIEGYVLQIGPVAWAWQAHTERKGDDFEAHSAGLSATQTAPTRDGAIAMIGQDASRFILRWIDKDGINADFKKIKVWADDLLVNGENAECLETKPKEKKAKQELTPASSWPFPTGSRP
jgi:ParB/RepB/Spo0J family partition protein